MPPIAAYVRVSHVGTRAADRFHSPHDQRAEIETWAKANGHPVDFLPPELDAKGSDAERPIFRQAIEGVRDGTYSGVVVAYLSRAGRDLRLMLDLWDEVQDAGGIVYSARENIDASTPSGRLHRNLLASIAQHELEERREGFDRARAGAVEAGIWQRHQAPRGYRRDKTTRKLVGNRQADSVRGAFADFLAGKPVAEIARGLRMTPSGVRQLLRNRVYLGELRVGEHVNPSAHPALIEVATFEAAQARLDAGVRPARSGRGPALLAGLSRCSTCGHVMTRSNGKSTENYTCTTHHSGERCPAPVAIAVPRLDAYAERIALAELARLEVTAADGNRVAQAQSALDAAERELSAYLDAIGAADVGAEAFAKGARTRRDAVDEAKALLSAELARIPGLPTSGTGAEVWEDLNPHERNTLLRGLFAAVVVRPAGRGRKVPIEERARVIAFGAPIPIPTRNHGRATGVQPIPFPDLDAEGVLSVPLDEDRP